MPSRLSLPLWSVAPRMGNLSRLPARVMAVGCASINELQRLPPRSMLGGVTGNLRAKTATGHDQQKLTLGKGIQLCPRKPTYERTLIYAASGHNRSCPFRPVER